MDFKAMLKEKVRLNEDEKIVDMIRKGLKEKGGYCPCKLGKLPENKCICEEFRAQIMDENYEGLCHCGLYYTKK